MIVGWYMLKIRRVIEDNLRDTGDNLNDVQRRVTFGIIDAGSLMRNAVPPPSV